MTAFGALPDSKKLYFWPLLVVHIEVESKSSRYFSQEVTLMETTKAPETPRVETTLIGPSMVIKGELSCSEDLYIDGQVEGVIDPK